MERTGPPALLTTSRKQPARSTGELWGWGDAGCTLAGGALIIAGNCLYFDLRGPARTRRRAARRTHPVPLVGQARPLSQPSLLSLCSHFSPTPPASFPLPTSLSPHSIHALSQLCGPGPQILRRQRGQRRRFRIVRGARAAHPQTALPPRAGQRTDTVWLRGQAAVMCRRPAEWQQPRVDAAEYKTQSGCLVGNSRRRCSGSILRAAHLARKSRGRGPGPAPLALLGVSPIRWPST
jgi:hypothetical protein